MMQGRGVTNFSNDKPSHDYSATTTEFDDELIKRGIVTTEQCLMAKGASLEEATRLIEEEKNDKKRGKDSQTSITNRQWYDIVNDDTVTDNNDDESFQDDSDDDVFMERYRQQRLQQLQRDTTKPTHSQPTSVTHITRDEWKAEVNDASMGGRWVIITMVETTGRLKDNAVQELHKIGNEYCNNSYNTTNDENSDDDDDDDELFCKSRNNSNGKRNFKLLTINADDAIPNWPEERVPAIFAYRYGMKQHEWIANRRGEFPSRAHTEELLRSWKVI